MVPCIIIFKKGNPYEKIERSISHSLVVLLEPLHDRQKKKHTRGTEGVRCHRESRTSGEQRDERDRRCSAALPEQNHKPLSCAWVQGRCSAGTKQGPHPAAAGFVSTQRQRPPTANHSRFGLGQRQRRHEL